ncbi:putative vacuolar membrane transporter for cationic amino acids [Microbotryomycetes sp. JL201]|nr:putative vacuolar membrane transporter for cationic amino acids [Microbotryomycetes sp. JL201]
MAPLALLTSLVASTVVGALPKHPHEHDPDMVYDGFPRLANIVGTLYTPQLWLCVVQQSGEGLSLVFLIIWLAGDLTNLLGTVWQGLLPTMILLAFYYTACDVILIFQVFYYRRKRALYPHLYSSLASDDPASTAPVLANGHIAPPATEHDPLLSAYSAHGPSEHEFDPKVRRWRNVLSYVGGLLFVVAIGLAAWWMSTDVPLGRKREVWDTKAQVVGWISAFLYLGSRLPQIYKNMETKCQGLSLMMFAFAVLGNVTYVASILLQSVAADHLLINASWLVGSGGTVFLDFIVLSQFFYYAGARKQDAKVFNDDEEDGLVRDD